MRIYVYVSEKLFRYGFPPPHPLKAERYRLFSDNISFLAENDSDIVIREPKVYGDETLMYFHTERYVEFVRKKSESGVGYLDYGDTPAYSGVYEVSRESVYATLDAVYSTLNGGVAVNLAGGWHHSYPDRASGFCVFNDIGVSINSVLDRVDRILYIDIDAHHGDGVYYPYESDPRIYIFDVHQDPNTLFPGTGFEWERGSGDGEGTKVNICLPPGSGSGELHNTLDKCLSFAREVSPDYIIIQAGLDGLIGDPLSNLEYSLSSHLQYIINLVKWGVSQDIGIVLLGGGGYQPRLFSLYWLGLVESILLVG